MNTALLLRGLEALALPTQGSLPTLLARYVEELETWNPAYGLVGASGDELIVKHILDSLAPISVIRSLLSRISTSRAPSNANRNEPTAPPLSHYLADLGSGAGLPGIPIALALPELRVSLVDRMGKRIRFLESMKASLPLPNVEIVESEVERAPGSYDLVTFRAFRPFERKLFKRVFALCESDGFVIAYKGKKEKALDELNAVEGLFSESEILPVKVPFLDDERCLVILRPAPRK